MDLSSVFGLLRLLPFLSLLHRGLSVKCYSCVGEGGSSSCRSDVCEDKFCFKAEGLPPQETLASLDASAGPVYAEGKTVVKKGCIGYAQVTPDTCLSQSINLPGFRVTQGKWCVCDKDFCNGAAGKAAGVLLLLPAFLLLLLRL